MNQSPTNPASDALLRAASFSTTTHGSPCSLHHELRRDRLVLVVKGSTSTALPEAFTEAVVQLFSTLHPKHVSIDLSGCPSLHSVMLAFLVYFQKLAEEHGAGKVVLHGVNPRIATMIKMIGMSDFFVVVRDDAEADAHFLRHR